MTVRRFENDDDGYARWLRSHAAGFVINTYPTPSAKYLKLHRAGCHTIDPARGRPLSRWTNDYIKVCGDQKGELRSWALDFVGAEPDPCRKCGP